MNKQKRLGRGLEALLNAAPPTSAQPVPSGGTAEALSDAPASVPFPGVNSSFVSEKTSDPDSERIADFEPGDRLLKISVNDIDENPFQPRRQFHESEIASLSASLTEHDMLQPILVRPVGTRFQLISGERRLRAAIRAGWMKIPAKVREADDRLVAELAIVENLQRKDLNALEKAMSFRRYIDEHACTQEELAGRLKIDRSTLTNLMRLLELPTGVQDAIRNEKISAGHGRALLPLGDADLQIQYCNRIQKEGLNVRQTEKLVSDFVSADLGTHPKPTSTNPQIVALQQELKMALGTRVDIKANKKGAGKLTIHFQNAKEFERIRRQLRQDPARDAA